MHPTHAPLALAFATGICIGITLLAQTAQAQAQPQAQAQAQAQDAAPAEPKDCIEVEVQNVRPLKGWLFLAAYGSADTYGKQPLASVKTAAKEATTRLTMCGITTDTVAISMYQDLDSDGKMGRNVLGMPTEPWGSSGKPGALGPAWDTGKVVRDGRAVVVTLSQ